MSCCGLNLKFQHGTLTGEIKKVKRCFRDKHIISIFEERLRQGKIRGSKTAISFPDRACLTYTQLNAFASCLSKNIIERLGYDYKIDNPDKDLLIAVCVPMSEKAMSLILAILKTGAAYLPLDPRFPENLLLNIVESFKPVLLITDDNGKIFNKYDVEKFASICQICSLEELWIDIEFTRVENTRRASMEFPWKIDFLEKLSVPDSDRTVAVFYSRGLSGDPVGVRISSRAIINLVWFHWNKVELFSKNMNCCVTVPLASKMSIPQIFIPLLCGCGICLFRRQDVDDTENFLKVLAWKDIARLSIETHVLPRILDVIEFIGKEKILKLLKRLTVIVCRGAFIDFETARKFFSIFKSGVKLVNCVGAVETSGVLALQQYSSLKEFESKLINGQVVLDTLLDNIKVYIVDENMNLLPDGSVGEMYVSGDCLALGYVGNHEGQDSDMKFMKNPFTSHPPFEMIFKTGEFARIQKGKNKQRVLHFHGRHDHLIRVRGNIFSGKEVEEYVKHLEGVGDAKIFLLNPGSRSQQMIVWILLKKGVEEDSTLVADYEFSLKAVLPEWAIPDEFKFYKKCLPECPHPRPLCPDCCMKMAITDWNAARINYIEHQVIKPYTAEVSNHFG